ncbi:MAG: three-Cys-motif partner protein TcmP [Rhizobiaceae bacterium]|nr:three-Cys-motif partner protein TcmP [Rhizobiaceae bacterium]
MAKKEYDWLNGAELLDHTKRKLKILDDYLFDYLTIRCQLPQQQKFRLAIVDGFAGGGRYRCGSAGSPIVFIQGLERALNKINIDRAVQGLGEIELECLLILNDRDADVVELLKTNCAPLLAAIKTQSPKLHVQPVFMAETFERAYPGIKALIQRGRYRSVLFNLDQCGVSQINLDTVLNIMNVSPSVEIFYTFVVKSLLAYLSKNNPTLLASQLRALDVSASEQTKLHEGKSNDAWMGAAERLVFENFHRFARYVSPFSINNPDGWRYWLIHFSNSYRARQAYNMVLHANASMQAHFGRSGLNMLSYDPRDDEGQAYLFDTSGRQNARDQLMYDIPRLVTDQGDAIGVEAFYEGIYNLTPAHRDDIHTAIGNNPDLEVFTPSGGKRQKSTTISAGDTLKLKSQKSFFPMFPPLPSKGRGS